MPCLMWFREDLRVTDNTALYKASQKSDDGIIAIYIIDTSMWNAHHIAACRVEFILRGLAILQLDLAKLNINLCVIDVKSTAQIPRKILQLCNEFSASALFFNRQYEVNESRRDDAVVKLLEQHAIKSYACHDQAIIQPGRVLTLQDKYFSVFTPFKRAWFQALSGPEPIVLSPRPKKQKVLNIKTQPIPKNLKGFTSTIDPAIWPAGEKAAQKRLNTFISKSLFRYDQLRDFPAIDGTSKLSPYLAAGMISARQCFQAAFVENNGELDTGNKGVTTWLGELVWRDFYKHILVAAPRVSMSKAYKISTEKLPWDYDENKARAWQQGLTGFPLIDAAMRQLNTQGWMHNRLRMVVAMFYSKNLFFNWREGEKYFAENLIDSDLSANNGGWQWSASTGTDAAPYFRIFNPIRQSERFDPDGEFIRQYCPELNDLTSKQIHEPYVKAPHIYENGVYPKPIINLAGSRERVIAAFKLLK
jgi:deoxyribodipyrimidine photo-lyase